METTYPPIAHQRRIESGRSLYHIHRMERRRALFRSRIQQCKRKALAAHTELNLAMAYEHRVAQRAGPALVSDLCVWAASSFVVLAVLALGNRLMVSA